jgi:hypothetical protein
VAFEEVNKADYVIFTGKYRTFAGTLHDYDLLILLGEIQE